MVLLCDARVVRVGVPKESEQPGVPSDGEFLLQSNVVDQRYSQSFSVDLFFIHQWEEGHWGVTQHRSFRSLNTTYIPQRLVLINSESLYPPPYQIYPFIRTRSVFSLFY